MTVKTLDDRLEDQYNAEKTLVESTPPSPYLNLLPLIGLSNLVVFGDPFGTIEQILMSIAVWSPVEQNTLHSERIVQYKEAHSVAIYDYFSKHPLLKNLVHKSESDAHGLIFATTTRDTFVLQTMEYDGGAVCLYSWNHELFTELRTNISRLNK